MYRQYDMINTNHYTISINTILVIHSKPIDRSVRNKDITSHSWIACVHQCPCVHTSFIIVYRNFCPIIRTPDFKGPYADHILIPRVQPEVVLFCCQIKAHIFLIINPKFQLQICYTLEVIAENVHISGIPILIF